MALPGIQDTASPAVTSVHHRGRSRRLEQDHGRPGAVVGIHKSYAYTLHRDGLIHGHRADALGGHSELLSHQARGDLIAVQGTCVKKEQRACQSEPSCHASCTVTAAAVQSSCRANAGPASILTLVLLHQARSDVIAAQGGCRANAGAVSCVGRR